MRVSVDGGIAGPPSSMLRFGTCPQARGEVLSWSAATHVVWQEAWQPDPREGLSELDQEVVTTLGNSGSDGTPFASALRTIPKQEPQSIFMSTLPSVVLVSSKSVPTVKTS